MFARIPVARVSRALTQRPIIRSHLSHSHIVQIRARASFHQSCIVRASRSATTAEEKSQDKNAINTEASEYSRSGTDSEVAQSDGAFDPSTTKPDESMSQTGKGKEGNPLDVSPANSQVSKQRPQEEGGAEKSPQKNKNEGSGQGSPAKGKKI